MQLNRVATLFIVAFMATTLPAFTAFSQVVINEIMQNPEFAGDTDGEWFELYNAGGLPLDINGWTILDNGTNDHVINAPTSLVIQSQGYLVLGRNADQKANGNVPVDYSYGSDITFSNGVDQLILVDRDGVEQDRVEYDDGVLFPDPTGASMELLHPAADNNNGSFWREAVTSWGGNDKGTPGFMNSVFDSLPPIVISVRASLPIVIEVIFGEIVDSATGGFVTNYEISPDIGTPISAQRDTTNPALIHLNVSPLSEGVDYTLSIHGVTDLVGNVMVPGSFVFSLANPLSENDVIVTEVMKDPLAVGDTDGEWFEVYNTTNQVIDMGGWTIYDGGSNSLVVQGTLLISPQSFAVFCINTDSAVNGGLHASTMYDWGSSGTFTLGNAEDKIILRSDGIVIDSVNYDSGISWPDLTGSSMALSDFTIDNNIGENWTPGLSRQPAYNGLNGDLGSPGSLGDNQSIGSGPSITVDPDTLRFVIASGEPANLPFTVRNTGSQSLTWSISYTDTSCFWLTIDPAAGEIMPGEAESIRVHTSSDGLATGVYTCTVLLESNDPVSPQMTIPVILSVLDTTVTGSILIPNKFLPLPVEGDTVSMEIMMINKTSVKRNIDTWITLLRPGEPEPRKLIDVKHMEISSFQELTRTRSLYIPPHSPGGIYALTLHLGQYPDSVSFSSTFLFEKALGGKVTRSGQWNSGIPVESFLDQSYPSPFNASTTILYGISEDTWVTLSLYDLLGREIVKLVNEFQFAGYKTVSWDGRNSLGLISASGPYLYRIEAGNFAESRTLMLMK